MANSFAYASIEKTNKNDDGTLTVYGKATDDSLDIDQQICDSDWLKRAMPEWMVSGGNVREQHSSIAAGVATEYEEKGDGHYITALVVDPVSVKKVETGVLKGFSIGIKGPRVIRDTKAAGGRIVDGQIVEISLVDRPANPNAKLVLAKSVAGELVKYDPDQERDESGRFSSGGGSAYTSGDAIESQLVTGFVTDENGNFSTESLNDSIAFTTDDDDDFDNTDDQPFEGGGSSAGLSGAPSGADLSKPIPLTEQEIISSADGAMKYFNSIPFDQQSDNVVQARQLLDTFRDNANQTQAQSTPATALNSAEIALGAAEDAAVALSSAQNLNDDEKSWAQAIFNTAYAYERSVVNPLREAAGQEAVEPERRFVKSNIPTPKDVAAMVNKNADPVEPVEEATEETVEATELTEAEQVEKAAQLLNLTKSFTAELVKFDQATFDRAKRELANLIIVEAGEMAEKGHDERNSLRELLKSVEHLFAWYEGEMVEGEVGSVAMEEILMAAEADETSDDDMCEKCGETMKMCKCADKALYGEEDAEEAEEDSTEKSLDIDDATTVAIIEKAVTQAKESVKEEIGLLKSALEAAQVEASQLADELATAKTAVAGGGPKRAVTKATDISVDTLLQKAAEYSVKASLATDTVLAQGYRELAADLTTKASRKDVNTNV